MSRSPAKVTQADIARAIRAITQTGANLVVEITPEGTIRLVPAESDDPKVRGGVDKKAEIIL